MLIVRRLRLLALVVAVATLLAGSARAADDPLRLHLIWTNDVHGHIAPEPARFMNPEFPPPLGGAPSAAAYIKRVRAEAEAAGEPVILMDVGDIFQGTPIGSKTEGRAVVDYFNAIGYDFLVPGNHDFDLGRDVAADLAERSAFPWVAANLMDESDGEVVDWCVPNLMLERAGLQIGVIGIITPATANMSFPENIAGLDFQAMAPHIRKQRDLLKDRGADFILLGIHEGLPFDPEQGWATIAGAELTDTEHEHGQTYGANYSGDVPNLMELMNQVAGVDLAVGGHTHRGYQEPWIDPVNHTLCFETYGNGSSIGHAILLIDRASKQIMGWEPSHDRGTIITLFEDEILPDEEITEVIRPYQEQTERPWRAWWARRPCTSRGAARQQPHGQPRDRRHARAFRRRFLLPEPRRPARRPARRSHHRRRHLPRAALRQRAGGRGDGRPHAAPGARAQGARRQRRPLHLGRHHALRLDPARLGSRRVAGSGR